VKREIARKAFLLATCGIAVHLQTGCSYALVPYPETWTGKNTPGSQQREIEISSFKVMPENVATNSKLAVEISIRYTTRMNNPIIVELVIAGVQREKREILPAANGESIVEFNPIIRTGGIPIVSVTVSPTGNDLLIAPDTLSASKGIRVYPNLSADLSFSDLAITPEVASPGAEVNISGKVYYCCYPELPIEVVLREGTKLLQSQEFAGGERSGRIQFEFKFSPVSTGSQILELEVDPKKIIEERFETNNIATLSMEVK
jgi:hypothetical protein